MTAAGHKWVRFPWEWHAVADENPPVVDTLCGLQFWAGRSAFSDFDPVEDECRLCRRALDGGKAP